MKLALSLIKELAETLIRNFKLLGVKPEQDIESSISALKRQGYCDAGKYFSSEQCEYLRCQIDSLLLDDSVKTWKDQEGADCRIYFAEDLLPEFKKFYQDSKNRAMLAGYTGLKDPVGMLLAARISNVDGGNLGSGGGWHRDSPFTHQFKSICYLSEVKSSNGPFQFIAGSHNKFDVIRTYFKKIFSPGQYRFSEVEINNYLESTNKKITDVVAEEGTLLYADTKGIHRGKPIAEGSRYALFCYFWNKEIPYHFKKFQQIKNDEH